MIESAAPSPERMASWLRVLVAPGATFEVRMCKPLARSAFFTWETIDNAVAEARRLSATASAVYFTINPLRSDIAAAAKDSDVLDRRLILVDLDPKRPRDTSSTEDELILALETARDVACYLAERGWPELVHADSGNGAHLLARCDLPNDAASRDLVKALLEGLNRRFGTAYVDIDVKVANASRITKFYGTITRKGEATAERPHRHSCVKFAPERLEPVSLEVLTATVQDLPQPALDLDAEIERKRATGEPRRQSPDPSEWTPERRASAYLAKCAPAVSGEDGHGTTFKTACAAGTGFDLPPNVAFRLLWTEWNPRCQPPWSARELRHKVDEAYKVEDRRGWLLDATRNGNGRRESNGHSANGAAQGARPAKTATKRQRFNPTDLGNAERFISRHGHDARYCHPWGKWLVFDGKRWAIDNVAAVRQRARETVRSIYGEAEAETDEHRRKELGAHAQRSEKRDRVMAMLSLAEAEEGVPILPSEMDRNPWFFNCLNGTVDLRTGELLPHRREDLITKLCPVEFRPLARCDLWDGTLKLFFGGDQEMTGYLQRICGYAMAGVVREHILPIAYGTGSNGKSTILGTLIDLFGPEYAMKAPPDMLMAKRNDGHPTDRADLFGKRLVVAIETEAGRRLNETMIKELTGGDRIRARRMREDFWEFSPSHTLIMATNHRPVVRGRDTGIWRRLKLVPFIVSVQEGKTADLEMPAKLKTELPGILAWCVRGCIDWQTKGLAEPKAVADATGEYRKEQDVLGAFLEENTSVGPEFRVRAGHLYSRYKAWAEAANEPVLTLTAFGMAIEERGISKKTSTYVWYHGLGLRSDGEH